MVSSISPVLVAVVTAGHASWVDIGTFAVAAAIVLSGAIGVVVARNPVHAALMLVMTLFGIAVLFVLQRDPFLAAVQVIVYAGAIVVLFLFVIMFLGVDREENVAFEPLRGQRPLAVGLVVLGTTGLLLLGQVSGWTTGAPHVAGTDGGAQSNVALLGRSVYTTYLFPFEATAALLVIAVVGCGGAGPEADGDRRGAGRGAATGHRRGRRLGTGWRLRWGRGRRVGIGGPGARISRAPVHLGRGPGIGRERGGRPVTINPDWYLALGVILFSIGALGVLIRRNVLVMFMCIELMLNAANLTFVTFARTLHDIGGQVLVFFVLVVAAAEVVVGLGIVVAIFRRRATAAADDLHLMKG